jgi:hypothetical protein
VACSRVNFKKGSNITNRSPDSSVSIVTRLGAGRQKNVYSIPGSGQLDRLGAQSAFFQRELETFLAQHLHVVLMLRVSGGIPPLVSAPSRSARTFTFYLYLYIRLIKTSKFKVSSIISASKSEKSNTTFGLYVANSFERVGSVTKVKLSLDLTLILLMWRI